MRSSNKVPPDGGYGWVVVFANALSGFLTIPIMQCFGLLFKDVFREMGISATQGSLILNLNGAFGKLTGPITAILLKTWGCRTTGIISAFLLTLGMILTSFAKNFAFFNFTYGIITSLGIQMSESTQRLALNIYFSKKRDIAMGFAVTFAGFGPILMPQLIRFLMKIYAADEVTLIIGAFCAHVFIAAILLQPVEWHIKRAANKQYEEEAELMEDNEENSISKRTRPGNSIWVKFVSTITKTFDLDLLKDPIFDNILLGVALATFAELNFTLLIPFMLHDFGLNTDQIAIFLSTLGTADIIFRFIGPYIGNYFTKPPRLMYVYALTLLVMIRFSLLFVKQFYILLLIAFALGIAKGVRKVYMWLVVPAHVPIEKLPSANGMETMANGICILIGGPILGALRDATGSYAICIVVMNFVTIITITLWMIEAIITNYKRKHSFAEIKPKNNEDIQLSTI